MKLSPCILLYLASEVAAAKLKPMPKMLLSKIDSLTLRNNQMTKSRRVEPIPQLKCVGGDGMGRYEIDVMRCKNQGSDYGDEDISWACSAELPREFKLGATDVICEGYDDPDDNYVLKGSCGVEYRLALTDYGYQKLGSSTFRSKSASNGNGNDGDWVSYGFWAIFIGILGWIIYSAYTNRTPRSPGAPRTAPAGGRPWFGGGGGGGGGGNDPPPPYDPKPRYTTSGQQQRSGPGFWTGAAAGAAASAAGSYLMGANRDRERAATNYGYNPSFSSGGYAGPSRSTESSSSESSTSGGTHSSTGFGQTRRR